MLHWASGLLGWDNHLHGSLSSNFNLESLKSWFGTQNEPVERYQGKIHMASTCSWICFQLAFCQRNSQYLNVPSAEMGDRRRWPLHWDTLMSWQSVEEELNWSRKIKKTKMTPIVLERCRKNGNLGNHYCDDKINFNCFSLFSVSAQVLWGRSIQPQSESWSIASSACAARNAQPVHSAKSNVSTCFQRRRCIRMHPGITNIYIAIIATLFFRLICSLEVWALLCPTMSAGQLQSWKTFKKNKPIRGWCKVISE